MDGKKHAKKVQENRSTIKEFFKSADIPKEQKIFVDYLNITEQLKKNALKFIALFSGWAIAYKVLLISPKRLDFSINKLNSNTKKFSKTYLKNQRFNEM